MFSLEEQKMKSLNSALPVMLDDILKQDVYGNASYCSSGMQILGWCFSKVDCEVKAATKAELGCTVSSWHAWALGLIPSTTSDNNKTDHSGTCLLSQHVGG